MEVKAKVNECTSQEEGLNDLPVTQEQAEAAKGGKGDIVPTDQVSVNFTKIEFK